MLWLSRVPQSNFEAKWSRGYWVMIRQTNRGYNFLYFNKYGTNIYFFTVQRFGPSPSPNLKFYLLIDNSGLPLWILLRKVTWGSSCKSERLRSPDFNKGRVLRIFIVWHHSPEITRLSRSYSVECWKRGALK